jgi:hypothetical protein
MSYRAGSQSSVVKETLSEYSVALKVQTPESPLLSHLKGPQPSVALKAQILLYNTSTAVTYCFKKINTYLIFIS